MTILGIDPGSTRIGYGIISDDKKLSLIDYGVLETGRKKTDLLILEAANKLSALLDKHHPDVVGIEKLYFAKNIKTGIEVAQMRGALILEVARRKILVKEFSPSEIKLSVTGYGLADKKAVAKMAEIMLSLEKGYLKGYDDATDALAIAITTANNKNTLN